MRRSAPVETGVGATGSDHIARFLQWKRRMAHEDEERAARIEACGQLIRSVLIVCSDSHARCAACGDAAAEAACADAVARARGVCAELGPLAAEASECCGRERAARQAVVEAEEAAGGDAETQEVAAAADVHRGAAARVAQAMRALDDAEEGLPLRQLQAMQGEAVAQKLTAERLHAAAAAAAAAAAEEPAPRLPSPSPAAVPAVSGGAPNTPVGPEGAAAATAAPPPEELPGGIRRDVVAGLRRALLPRYDGGAGAAARDGKRRALSSLRRDLSAYAYLSLACGAGGGGSGGSDGASASEEDAARVWEYLGRVGTAVDERLALPSPTPVLLANTLVLEASERCIASRRRLVAVLETSQRVSQSSL